MPVSRMFRVMSKGPVVSLGKKLYPHCSVLVCSSNGFERDCWGRHFQKLFNVFIESILVYDIDSVRLNKWLFLYLVSISFLEQSIFSFYPLLKSIHDWSELRRYTVVSFSCSGCVRTSRFNMSNKWSIGLKFRVFAGYLSYARCLLQALVLWF